MAEDPSRHIRVGHSERDAVAATLQEAAADGRLSMDELDERLDAALQAKTYADLDPLVADLGVPAPSQAVVLSPAPEVFGFARPQVYGPPPPGYSREDPLRLDGGMGTERRDGVWTVPPYLRVSQGVGSVRLNFLQAQVAAPIIEVEVVAGAGSALMILPDGWGVDADRLSKAWGTLSIKVPRQSAPGMPLFVLYGSVGMGSFRVRPARRRELRRAGLADPAQPNRPAIGR